MLLSKNLPPGFLKKKPRQLEIPPFTRRPPQLYQRQLDLGMARVTHSLPRSRSKHRINVVCVTSGYVQKIPFPRRLKMRHRSFEHVPRAIQLMIIPQICPTVARFLHGVITVQVTVWLLGSRENRDDRSEEHTSELQSRFGTSY